MIKDEWTQEEYIKQKKRNRENGIETLLVDTINTPIEGAKTVLYNPYELQQYPEGTVLVFYCDTGKASLERLDEYRKSSLTRYVSLSEEAVDTGERHIEVNIVLLIL